MKSPLPKGNGLFDEKKPSVTLLEPKTNNGVFGLR